MCSPKLTIRRVPIPPDRKRVMSTEAESVLRLAQVKREIRAAEHTLDA